MSPEEIRSQPQLLTQKRAGYALEVIRRIKAEQAAAYGRHVRRFPAMVQHNGLGQALAFLLADDAGGINGKSDGKGNWKPKEQTVTAAGQFYRDLEEWLCGRLEPTKFPMRVYSKVPNYTVSGGGKDQKGVWSDQLINQLIEGGREEYFRAQHETLALLHWMKRVADAFLPEDDHS